MKLRRERSAAGRQDTLHGSRSRYYPLLRSASGQEIEERRREARQKRYEAGPMLRLRRVVEVLNVSLPACCLRLRGLGGKRVRECCRQERLAWGVGDAHFNRHAHLGPKVRERWKLASGCPMGHS